jgi:hypothetical protein
MDPPHGISAGMRTDQQIIMGNLQEGIGIALDVPGNLLYATDLGGSVYRARLDGSERKILLSGQGSLTGIAYVPGR